MPTLTQFSSKYFNNCIISCFWHFNSLFICIHIRYHCVRAKCFFSFSYTTKIVLKTLRRKHCEEEVYCYSHFLDKNMYLFLIFQNNNVINYDWNKWKYTISIIVVDKRGNTTLSRSRNTWKINNTRYNVNFFSYHMLSLDVRKFVHCKDNLERGKKTNEKKMNRYVVAIIPFITTFIQIKHSMNLNLFIYIFWNIPIIFILPPTWIPHK